MRVFRRKGHFGTQVEIAGQSRARSAVELARLLGRPVGRNGGMRDPLPARLPEHKDYFGRDRYVQVSLTRGLTEWLEMQAAERGLSRASFAGLLIERAATLSSDSLDALIAGEITKADSTIVTDSTEADTRSVRA